MSGMDLSTWTMDKSYEDRMKLCEQLNLIETLRHGDEDFARLTQTGINVLWTLMHLARCASEENNPLKGS